MPAAAGPLPPSQAPPPPQFLTHDVRSLELDPARDSVMSLRGLAGRACAAVLDVRAPPALAKHRAALVESLAPLHVDLLDAVFRFTSPLALDALRRADARFADQLANGGVERYLQWQENTWRALYAQQPRFGALKERTLMLEDVCALREHYKFEEEEPFEAAMPKLLTRDRHRRTGEAVVNIRTFRAAFRLFTAGALDGLDWSNMIVAGGAVLACLLPSVGEPLSASSFLRGPFRGSDIDIFFYGMNEREAEDKIRHIYDVLARNGGCKGQVVRTRNAITFLGDFPHRHVQIVLRLYRSPAEVLMGFDLDSCAVCFDGDRVYAVPRFRRALCRQYNLVDMTRRSLSYVSRLSRYARRGFAVCVPFLDASRIDPRVFKTQLSTTNGLKRLLILDYLQSNPPKGPNRRRMWGKSATARSNADDWTGALEETGSTRYDYSLAIPWGPRWQAQSVYSLLKAKDQMFTFGTSFREEEEGESEHHHVVVTGIDGVLNGETEWCSRCSTHGRATAGPSRRARRRRNQKHGWPAAHPISDDDADEGDEGDEGDDAAAASEPAACKDDGDDDDDDGDGDDDDGDDDDDDGDEHEHRAPSAAAAKPTGATAVPAAAEVETVYLENLHEPLPSDAYVHGPIVWTAHDAGRQLLTGSFHPVDDASWVNDAYLSPVDQALHDLVRSLLDDTFERVWNPDVHAACLVDDAIDHYFGYRPLVWACLLGRDAAVDTMLATGAPVFSERPEVYNPLAVAAWRRDPDLLGRLLQHAPHVRNERFLLNPLRAAVASESVACFRLLVGAGLDVNATDQSLTTPLGYAICRAKLNMLPVLLECKDIDFNLPAHQNTSIADMLYACVNEGQFVSVYLTMFKLLLDAGFTLDAPAEKPAQAAPAQMAPNMFMQSNLLQLAAPAFGTAPFGTASIGAFGMQKKPSQPSAKPAAVLGSDELFADLSRVREPSEVEELDEWTMRRMRRLGLLPRYPTGELEYPVTNLLRELTLGELGSTASAAQVDSAYVSPLHVAARLSNVPRSVFESLVRAGADVNARDMAGQTPLHYAVVAGDAHAVSTLLKLGADPALRDCFARTPIDLLLMMQFEARTLPRLPLPRAAFVLAHGCELPFDAALTPSVELPALIEPDSDAAAALPKLPEPPKPAGKMAWSFVQSVSARVRARSNDVASGNVAQRDKMLAAFRRANASLTAAAVAVAPTLLGSTPRSVGFPLGAGSSKYFLPPTAVRIMPAPVFGVDPLAAHAPAIVRPEQPPYQAKLALELERALQCADDDERAD